MEAAVVIAVVVLVVVTLTLWRRNQLSLSCFWQRHRGLQFIIILCACVTREATNWLPASLQSFVGVDAQLQPKAKHEIGRTTTTTTTTVTTATTTTITVMGLAGCCCSG